MSFHRLAGLALIILFTHSIGAARPQASESKKEEIGAAVRFVLEKRLSVRAKPSEESEVLTILNPGDSIVVVGYLVKEKYFEIKTGARSGFISVSDITVNRALEGLIQKIIKAQQARYEASAVSPKAAAPIEPLDNETVKRQFLTMKFGKKVADAIMEHKVLKGMTKQMVRLSLGRPKAVKRISYPIPKKEQWDYGDGHYLFFEDGFLKADGGPQWSEGPPPER